MNNSFGVFGDPQFWGDVAKNTKSLPQDFVGKLSRFGQIPAQASDIADENFPHSARDGSTKNAFRHALGTGLIAQEMGGGAVGAAAAKAFGYLWEAAGVSDPTKLKKEWANGDIKHDLNANALGAQAAQGRDKAGLIDALKRMTEQSQVQQPPGVFQASPGYMTRTVQ